MTKWQSRKEICVVLNILQVGKLSCLYRIFTKVIQESPQSCIIQFLQTPQLVEIHFVFFFTQTRLLNNKHYLYTIISSFTLLYIASHTHQKYSDILDHDDGTVRRYDNGGGMNRYNHPRSDRVAYGCDGGGLCLNN